MSGGGGSLPVKETVSKLTVVFIGDITCELET